MIKHHYFYYYFHIYSADKTSLHRRPGGAPTQFHIVLCIWQSHQLWFEFLNGSRKVLLVTSGGVN